MGLFGGRNRSTIEEDTELHELDEFGQPRQPRERGSERGQRENSTGGGGGKKLILGGILALVAVWVLYTTDSIDDVIDTFSSTPEENLNAMLQGVRDVEKVNHAEGNLHPVYDVQNIYDSENIFKQVEKQYVVYIHNGDESLDSAFNEWVLANEKSVPIYRHAIYNLTDTELEAVLPQAPAFVLIYEADRGYKVVDSIVTTPNDFDTIPVTLDALKIYRQTGGEMREEEN